MLVKEIKSVLRGKVQMSKITYQFALTYHELASLLFQRQSINVLGRVLILL